MPECRKACRKLTGRSWPARRKVPNGRKSPWPFQESEPFGYLSDQLFAGICGISAESVPAIPRLRAALRSPPFGTLL
jgi:hypothetical protein